jgi:hypothetical protein
MKKKSQLELARAMISRLRIEMEKPRLAASVRKALEAEAVLAVKHPLVHPVGG